MKTTQTVYQLIKTKKDGTKKVIIDSESSCVEKAMDYFFTVIPESYYNPKYRIRIKVNENMN